MGIVTAPVAGRPAGTAPAIGLTTPRRRRARWVPPLMAVAVVLLIGGLWEGLVYLGLPLAAGQHSLHVDHGPLMVLGFLGTLIALERAVALGPAWSYLAPAGAAVGGLAVTCNAPNGVGQAVVTLGGVILVAIFVAVHRIQASLSWKASVTLLHTASDTPATLIRVTSSVRASAARSRSEYTTGASDQPAITSSLR